MNRRQITSLLFFICCGIFYLAGCSKKVVSQSIADTPRNHYQGGIQKLENNDMSGAQTDFLRAIELDKKSPYGYTGMAFLELIRTNYKKALHYANRAIGLDPTFVEAYIIKGRIITMSRSEILWFDKAVQSFKQALTFDPDNRQVLFYLAECYLRSQRYSEAAKYYKKVSEQAGVLGEKALERYNLTVRIIELHPLSQKGGDIVLDDKIDRADLSILIVKELQLKSLIKRYRPYFYNLLYTQDGALRENEKIALPHDVYGTLPEKVIQEIISYHFPSLDVFPNVYFYPHKLVTRAQIARTIQDILVTIKDDESLATWYIGKYSPFPDVHADYYAFNAIMLAIELGIIVPYQDGMFNCEGTVSGLDALFFFRNLENILR